MLGTRVGLKVCKRASGFFRAAGPNRRQLGCRRRRGDAAPAGRFRPLGQARDRGLVVGRSASASRRTSDVAAARSQAEAALGAYSTDEGEQSEKRNGTDGQRTGGQAFLARARWARLLGDAGDIVAGAGG